jgi:hypothetical protein
MSTINLFPAGSDNRTYTVTYHRPHGMRFVRRTYKALRRSGMSSDYARYTLFSMLSAMLIDGATYESNGYTAHTVFQSK